MKERRQKSLLVELYVCVVCEGEAQLSSISTNFIIAFMFMVVLVVMVPVRLSVAFARCFQSSPTTTITKKTKKKRRRRRRMTEDVVVLLHLWLVLAQVPTNSKHYSTCLDFDSIRAHCSRCYVFNAIFP